MKNKIQIYGVLGLIGTMAVGIGQFLMHYSGQGYAGDDIFDFLKNVPQENIRIGHYLAVLFLPFYIAGYWHLYLLFLPAKPQYAKWLYRLSVFSISFYTVWIGSQALLSVMVKDDYHNGIEHYLLFNQNLIVIAYIGFFVISFIFFYIVWSGQSILPKWVAFFNVGILLALIHGISYLVPSIENFILASPINLAHFILFGLSTYFSFKSKQPFPPNLDI